MREGWNTEDSLLPPFACCSCGFFGVPLLCDFEGLGGFWGAEVGMYPLILTVLDRDYSTPPPPPPPPPLIVIPFKDCGNSIHGKV